MQIRCSKELRVPWTEPCAEKLNWKVGVLCLMLCGLNLLENPGKGVNVEQAQNEMGGCSRW